MRVGRTFTAENDDQRHVHAPPDRGALLSREYAVRRRRGAPMIRVYPVLVLALFLCACGGTPPSTQSADASTDLTHAGDVGSATDLPVAPDGAISDAPVTFDVPARGDDVVEDLATPGDVASDVHVAPDVRPACTSDAACIGSAQGPVCDLASGRCVACTPADDRCPRGQYCVAGMNVCAPGCADRADCDGATPECNTATHACVECLSGDCPGLGGAICIDNRCVGACMGPRACTSGQTCCMFACVDTQTSTENCGDCFRRCAPPNAVAACSAGVCGVARCVAPYGDCDGNATNGCEANTSDNVAHCGGCGMACATRPNTVTTCEMGACRYACASGFADCDGSTTNGCEANLATTTHCGACGMACPLPSGPRAVARCSASGGVSACGLVCESGFVDCDRNVANGCEAMGACTVERELFYDGFEAGGSRWVMDPVWRVFNAGFFSPCAGTLEMFGERRVTDPCDVAGNVTLASPIDISRATALTLTHQSRSYVSGGIQLDVSASGDGGRTWSVVATQGTNTCGAATVDLGAFVGRPTLLLRFSYRGTRACDSGFWRLDEVRVRATVRNY